MLSTLIAINISHGCIKVHQSMSTKALEISLRCQNMRRMNTAAQ